MQTYKICNGKDKIKPDLLFTTVGENPDRQTRFTTDPLNIAVKRSRIEIRKNLYVVRVAGDWNKLNHDIKTSSTAASFNMLLNFFIQADRWRAQQDKKRATQDHWQPTSCSR